LGVSREVEDPSPFNSETLRAELIRDNDSLMEISLKIYGRSPIPSLEVLKLAEQHKA
jgi:hypothetical protein